MKKTILTILSTVAFTVTAKATVIGDTYNNPCAQREGVGCSAMTTSSLPTLIVQGEEVDSSSEAYNATLVREAQAYLEGESSVLVKSVDQAQEILKGSK